VAGHRPNSHLDELLPWTYLAASALRDVALITALTVSAQFGSVLLAIHSSERCDVTCVMFKGVDRSRVRIPIATRESQDRRK
jgi:hypothetical protein